MSVQLLLLQLLRTSDRCAQQQFGQPYHIVFYFLPPGLLVLGIEVSMGTDSAPI